jgi:hypothetical protein
MTSRTRFNTFIDDAHGFLVVRPIGDLPGPEFAARVIDFYRSLEAPWRYNRIIDGRRHDAYMTDQDRATIAEAWAGITSGIDYRALVALVVRDRWEKLRLPEISAQFPNETVCCFCDYHEAVGWVLSQDRQQFLSNLGQVPVRRRDEHAIDGL